MAGMLLCLPGSPNESQVASAFEQVDWCSIVKFVVEGSAFGQVGISALQEGKARCVVQEALRLEEEQRKEVAPRRRSLCAKA